MKSHVSVASKALSKAANLLTNNTHPNAQARRGNDHRPGENIDVSMDQPCLRTAEKSDDDGAHRKENNPSSAADGRVCDNDRLIVRWWLRSILSVDDVH